MIMMCHCRFILDFKKMYTLVNDVDNERGYESVGARGIWAISVPSLIFL